MFSEATNFVKGVDEAFAVILGISLFFFLAITLLMIFFVIRYNKKRHPKATQVKENVWLEITWTVIPFILVMVMFWWGWKGFQPTRKVPADALVIKSVSQMWKWNFIYPNGKEFDTLYLPLNKPVKIEMTSLDVIHSLYIPAFRIKEDMVPGKQTFMWFIPQEVGKYELFCAEYCGLRHSYMETRVYVVPEDEYNQKIASLPEKSSLEDHPGLELLKANACISCHSLDGSKLVGPSFKGLFNSEKIVVTDGKDRTIIADREYIKQSIIEPNKDVVKGYVPGMMQSYEKILTSEKIDTIIDYIETIGIEK